MYSATDTSIPCPSCGGGMRRSSGYFLGVGGMEKVETIFRCDICGMLVEIQPVTNAAGQSNTSSFSETRGTG